MNGLMIHQDGSRVITRDELDLIAVPEPTESYVPVSHRQLADTMLTVSQDILRDYALVGENYGIARKGNQLFAVLKFQNEKSEMGLSLAFRNSYDRSMAIGLAMGASVFCCDNLSLTGEIVVMKKHTKNVWAELEETAITTIYKSQKNYEQIVADSQGMRALPMPDIEAFKMMGLLFGRDIIGPRQLTVLKDEWLHPSHNEFQPRNLWSFYNAGTESLKSSPPLAIMEKHIRFHETLKEASHAANSITAGLLEASQ